MTSMASSLMISRLRIDGRVPGPIHDRTPSRKKSSHGDTRGAWDNMCHCRCGRDAVRIAEEITSRIQPEPGTATPFHFGNTASNAIRIESLKSSATGGDKISGCTI